MRLAQEYTPAEDRARVNVMVIAPEGASLQYTQRFIEQVGGIAKDEVDRGNAARVIQRTGNFNRQSEVSSGMVMLPLTLWENRKESAAQIAQRLRQRTQDIPGARIFANTPGGLGGNGKPVQLVLQGPEYREIADLAEKVQQAGIDRQALIIVGDVLAARREGLKAKSLLYDEEFSHGFREGHVA